MITVEERSEFVALLALPPGSRLLEIGDGTFDPTDESDGTYDGVLCIDAIAQCRDRGAVLAAWARAVRPGGRILYTDPAIVAGLLTGEELAARSASGYFVFSPQGENESLIESAGLRLLRADDATDALARSAAQRRAERAAREAELGAEEGSRGFVDRQRLLEVTYRLAAERRLARIAFLLEKPT